VARTPQPIIWTRDGNTFTFDKCLMVSGLEKRVKIISPPLSNQHDAELKRRYAALVGLGLAKKAAEFLCFSFWPGKKKKKKKKKKCVERFEWRIAHKERPVPRTRVARSVLTPLGWRGGGTSPLSPGDPHEKTIYIYDSSYQADQRTPLVAFRYGKLIQGMAGQCVFLTKVCVCWPLCHCWICVS